MAQMKVSSVLIQCCVRCKLARRRVAEERLRAAGGPAVVEVLRRAVNISGRTLTLILYRSGISFKVVGNDLINGCQYVGFVYQPEIMDILKEHNSHILVCAMLLFLNK